MRTMETGLAQETRGMPWLEDASFRQLLQARDQIAKGNIEDALSQLDEIQPAYSQNACPSERMLTVFCQALRQVTQQTDSKRMGNLYMDHTDVGAMIRAFEVLVTHTPFIRFAYSAANQTIQNHCANLQRVQLMDIGVGAGNQWFDLIDRMTARQSKCAEMRLIGIDVPPENSTINHKLINVGNTLETYARTCGTALAFHPVCAKIEELDLRQFRDASNPLIINALLALHHTPSSDSITAPECSRDAVLRRLQQLQPTCFVLVEPDSNHDSLAFRERVGEALKHYSTVFEALDNLLARDLPERATLENAFFGKEIMNIVAGEKADRVERHQRRQAWQKSMADAGFTQLQLPINSETLTQELGLTKPFTITEDQGMLVLRCKGSPLLSASAYTCRS